MAKSEAKNFFSDDRLLIEKYIENPVRTRRIPKEADVKVTFVLCESMQ